MAHRVAPRTKLDTFFDTWLVRELVILITAPFYARGRPLVNYVDIQLGCILNTILRFIVYSAIRFASESIFNFFNVLAVLEILHSIWSAVCGYQLDFPAWRIILHIVLHMYLLIATFLVYASITAWSELRLDWSFDKNIHLIHDLPLPPPLESASAHAPGDDDSSDDSSDKFSPRRHMIKQNAMRRRTPPKYNKICESDESDTADQIWAAPKATNSPGDVQTRSSDSFNSSTATGLPGSTRVSALDTSETTSAVHENHTQDVSEAHETHGDTEVSTDLELAASTGTSSNTSYQVCGIAGKDRSGLTLDAARKAAQMEQASKLQSLVDEMEKAAERDGPTCTAYRYRKKLEELFKTSESGDLTFAFMQRLLEYARNHPNEQTQKLWSHAIDLYDGVHHHVRNVSLWQYVWETENDKVEALRRIEEEKEHRLALEKQKEEAEAEREFELLKQLLEEDAKKAVVELQLASTRRTVRIMGDLSGENGTLGGKVRTLLPAKKVDEFWNQLGCELWDRTTKIFAKSHPYQDKLFKRIGYEAWRENLFNFDTAQDRPRQKGLATGVMHQWWFEGYKINIIEPTKTYNRYADALGALVPKSQMKRKFRRIFWSEMNANGSEWRYLIFLVILVAEDGKPTWWVGHYYRSNVVRACKQTGVDLNAYINLLHRKQAERAERVAWIRSRAEEDHEAHLAEQADADRIELEKKTKADTAIAELAALMKERREQQEAATRDEEAAQLLAQAQLAATPVQEEECSQEEEPISPGELSATSSATIEADPAREEEVSTSPEKDELLESALRLLDEDQSTQEENGSQEDEPTCPEKDDTLEAVPELPSEECDDDLDEFPEKEPVSAEEEALLAEGRAIVEAQLAAQKAMDEESDDGLDFPEEEPVSAEEEALLAENRAIVEAQFAAEKAAEKAATQTNTAAEAIGLQAQDSALMMLAEAAAQQFSSSNESSNASASLALIGDIVLPTPGVRLIKPTNPSSVYTLRPWDYNTSSFGKYWLKLASMNPVQQPTGPVTFDFRSVNQDIRLRSTSRSLRSAAVSLGNPFSHFSYGKLSPGRLIPPTNPSPAFVPKPWNPTAGNFLSYWRRLHCKHRKETNFDKKKDEDAPLFNFRYAKEEKLPQSRTWTLQPASGYALQWRTAVALAGLPAKTRQALKEQGLVWPRNWDPVTNPKIFEPELHFTNWVTLRKVPAVFGGLKYDAEKRMGDALTTDPEARELDAWFAEGERRAQELRVELWIVSVAAGIALPEGGDEDLAREPEEEKPSSSASSSSAPLVSTFDPSAWQNMGTGMFDVPSFGDYNAFESETRKKTAAVALPEVKDEDLAKEREEENLSKVKDEDLTAKSTPQQQLPSFRTSNIFATLTPTPTPAAPAPVSTFDASAWSDMGKGMFDVPSFPEDDAPEPQERRRRR